MLKAFKKYGKIRIGSPLPYQPPKASKGSENDFTAIKARIVGTLILACYLTSIQFKGICRT